MNGNATWPRPSARRMAVTLVLGLILFKLPIVIGQEIDPFYLKLIESGEKAYLAKNYDIALKDLEIGVFGVARSKDLRAKTFLYMSLCCLQLKNSAKCEEYFRSAAGEIGIEALLKLEIVQAAKLDVEKLAKAFKLAASPPPSTKTSTQAPAAKPLAAPADIAKDAETAKQKAAPEIAPRVSAEIAGDLEKQIQAHPRDADLYYRLADIYAQDKNFKAHERTIERLLENNPIELGGYLILGRLQYQARSLKKAEANLEKFLTYTLSMTADPASTGEAKILMILSASLRGDTKKVQKWVPTISELMSPEALSHFPLDAEDKVRLQNIWKMYGFK